MTPRNYEKNGRDHGKGERLRSAKHRAWVRQHLCLAWARRECQGAVEAAHCRDVAPAGHGGSRPGDEWCAPMCRRHHAEAEKRERAWGLEMGIDVAAECADFASKSPDKAIREAAKEMRKALAPVMA